mgnify:CR=1 FL=1
MVTATAHHPAALSIRILRQDAPGQSQRWERHKIPYEANLNIISVLQKIAAQSLGRPVTLVLDNARSQHCRLVQCLAEQLGIELLFLPSYSPNLNLIERLWKFTKKTALRGRYYATFADFRAAIDACLAPIDTTHRPQLATLMTHNFQTFDNVSLLVG